MAEQQSEIRRLIDEAREGNVASREELFRRCRNYLAVVARTQVETWMRQKVDASDLVQQTMLDAYRGFDQFAGHSEAEWLGWLKQILQHNAQDFIRRYRTAKRAAGREIPQSPIDDSQRVDGLASLRDDLPTPSQVLMAHEQELTLADCITQLPPDYQEVIHLRSLQRLPFDEVATRMGRSRAATQMLWMRALQKLESLLTSPDRE